MTGSSSSPTRAGALAWADAVHYAPHRPIDVAARGVDVLLCSPYKFFGPHFGLAFGREELLRSWRPYKVRPAADEPVGARFETGTLAHELLAGFVAAVEYLDRARLGCDPGDERALGQRFLDGLPDRCTLYGLQTMDGRVPTFAFGSTASRRATSPSGWPQREIAVWDGDYYAVEAMTRLGLQPEGAVRAGFRPLQHVRGRSTGSSPRSRRPLGGVVGLRRFRRRGPARSWRRIRSGSRPAARRADRQPLEAGRRRPRDDGRQRGRPRSRALKCRRSRLPPAPPHALALEDERAHRLVHRGEVAVQELLRLVRLRRDLCAFAELQHRLVRGRPGPGPRPRRSTAPSPTAGKRRRERLLDGAGSHAMSSPCSAAIAATAQV